MYISGMRIFQKLMSQLSEKHKEELVRIIKFGIIGVFNTGIFFIFFFIFLNMLSFHYLAATTLAYCVAIINSFIANKSWTFGSKGNSHRKFIKFVAVNIVAIIVNSIMMFLLVDIGKIHPWIAQVVTICFTMCVNYIGNRFWTFNDNQLEEGE